MPPSPICERAIEDATTYGKAVLKFISANDVGLTGGHQYGYYLPLEVWYLFSPTFTVWGLDINCIIPRFPASLNWFLRDIRR